MKPGGKTELYRELLFEQEGRCFICQLEEWRIRKRLHLHRIIAGKHGGTYTKPNLILVCKVCHWACEGATPDELHEMRRQKSTAMMLKRLRAE